MIKRPNIFIKKDVAKDFIEECNKKVISKDFIKECKEASKIFKRDKKLVLIEKRKGNIEFISKEGFRKQPKEIQEILFEYWKLNLNIGDLFLNTNDELVVVANEEDIKDIKEEEWAHEYITPLFTEGQLRKFIKEQTGSFIELRKYVGKRYLYLYSEFLGEYEQELQKAYLQDTGKW